jgi:ubiquinone/menaquinone biosynthesis C-methylase UbiE
MTSSGPVREGEISRKQASYELLPRDAKRVLDVGCGSGEDVLALAERLGQKALIVGIDSSLERIDEAQRALRNVALNAQFAVGDARCLPFPDHSFDVVRADGLFAELTERARVMRELSRVVAPGGRVLVHDEEAVVLASSADDDDLLGLMRRAGLASVEVCDSYARRPSDASPRSVILVGTKPLEPEHAGQR